MASRSTSSRLTQTVPRNHRQSAVSELPKSYRRSIPDDDRYSIELWRRHQATGDSDALNELCELWLPLVMALALYKSKIRRHLAHADIDDLISDGSISLFAAAQSGSFCGEPGQFRRYVGAAILNGFWRFRRSREWGGRLLSPEAKTRKAGLDFNRRFVRMHGRTPNAAERAAFLAKVVTNPNIQVGARRRMDSVTGHAEEDRIHEMLSMIEDRSNRIDLPMLAAETIRLAMKGLVGDDREIFKLAIDGVDAVSIGKRFGLGATGAQARVNGLLWRARCRVDLAKHLDVVPASSIPRRAGNAVAGIRNFPPARLAV